VYSHVSMSLDDSAASRFCDGERIRLIPTTVSPYARTHDTMVSGPAPCRPDAFSTLQRTRGARTVLTGTVTMAAAPITTPSSIGMLPRIMAPAPIFTRFPTCAQSTRRRRWRSADESCYRAGTARTRRHASPYGPDAQVPLGRRAHLGVPVKLARLARSAERDAVQEVAVVPDRRGLSDDLPRRSARIRPLASRSALRRHRWTHGPRYTQPHLRLSRRSEAVCAKRLRGATAPPLKRPQTRLGLGGARHHARGVVEEHRVLELRARVCVDPEDLRSAPARSGGVGEISVE
jgi:hypothetical protein